MASCLRSALLAHNHRAIVDAVVHQSRSASTSASGFSGLEPYLKGSAGSGRQKPYLSYVDQLRAQQLLKARVHLGHQKKHVNRKLTGLLQGFRHNIAIYDINKTWRSMRTVFYGFAEMAQSRSSFYLLAPNENLPLKNVIEHMRKQYPFRHDRFGSLYMTGYSDKKWIDGIFSNWKVTHDYARSVRKVLSEKPGLKKYRKLERYMRGIADLDLYSKVIPDFVLVLASDRGAHHEAYNADIPLIGLVDTNTDPTPFLYPVYANDDSVESCQFMLDLVRRGVEEGRRREQEMFALLMIRKIKQALDPQAGTSFEAAAAHAEAEAVKGGDTRRDTDAWDPEEAAAGAAKPAWLSKVNLRDGTINLDRVAAPPASR